MEKASMDKRHSGCHEAEMRVARELELNFSEDALLALAHKADPSIVVTISFRRRRSCAYPGKRLVVLGTHNPLVLLHEIAHIKDNDARGLRAVDHDAEWFKTYFRLVADFLPDAAERLKAAVSPAS